MIHPPSPKIRFNYQAKRFAFYRKDLLKAFLTELFLEEGQAIHELSYIFCTDEYLLAINRQFLQHDDYTDVITFNYAEKGDPAIGECYISTERVKENAAANEISFHSELLRVIIHGALHLCGYEDKHDQGKRMRTVEDKWLAVFEHQRVSRGTL